MAPLQALCTQRGEPSVELASVEGIDRGPFRVVRVRGEIDMSNCSEVDASIRASCGRAGSVVIDLTEVRFLDSSALHRLERIHGDLTADGSTCTIVASSDGPVHKLLDLTGLLDVLSVRTSLPDGA